ncbi:VirB4 family type IV secretion/conjugal transfer ATPase [Rickettsia endosymbiont of Cardiosporidium cionae]|uniref:VirB4 family type IV secretion/conjugal transfer ATPase n=1 Tax=Rickettsia endosymbiont of Cardiosporidium cionae TaxID=2777155 RepID=UPI0018940153|nr:VirB4 family type IV secretion/conjugal transfer ATPase [Rickettsia endosymbiont of Cardiosporidium cionae]KAF8818859.1 VirB4 family type IV secretion/conjugal transfer ATPase [Rickettsia endosymbiont of Cardiosporidium cionae]
MFTLFPHSQSRESIAKKEKLASNFIPYKMYWNSNTLITKDNNLLQVIKLKGLPFETTDDIELDINKNLRNMLFKNMSLDTVILYFHTIRKKTPVLRRNEALANTNNKNDFLRYLKSECEKKYIDTEAYINDFYITIEYKPDKSGVSIIKYLLEQFEIKSNKASWENKKKEIYDYISEVNSRILHAFRNYEPSVLRISKNQDGSYCQILEFLSQLVNCGDCQKIRVPKSSIDKYLPMNRLFFGSKLIESTNKRTTKYAGMLSIREYSSTTFAGIFDKLLQVPFEFIITQSFSFINKTVAIHKLQLQQNRMIQAKDNAVSQIEEISEALDMATSGSIAFGEHHMSMLCIGYDVNSIENILSLAITEFSNSGIQAVRETINMEPVYWGQLPGNKNYIVRNSIINTLNLASFVSTHNYPIGKEFDNHWGRYITILETTSNTPFYFSFHVNDVGHTLIIGPTGAGKTVLMNFLCAQACTLQPKMFFFDKDRGAEIFIRSVKGIYTVIDPGNHCGFNPLQLEDTGENRSFLLEWLITLVTRHGQQITSDEITLLHEAIEGNYRLDKADRKLSNIVPFLGLGGDGTINSRIAMWHGQGSHAKIFDNDIDQIDFNKSKIFGFEMANLLSDKISLEPVLLYIFHRINLSLDGTKTMIVLDEAWALIDNPIFAPKIKDWLKVLRKLNTLVIFATQSVEDATKSRISDTLVQQTATQIFLPNLKATEVYKEAFMLSNREFYLIKTIDPASRYFLVKQSLKSVIAKINLEGLNNIINILSSRADTIALLYKIMKKHGESPKNWLKIFYKKLASIKK